MDMGLTVRLDTPFAETVERVRAALKDQGFGVLTEIDVQATLRDKLASRSPNVSPRTRRPTRLTNVAAQASCRGPRWFVDPQARRGAA